MERRWRIARWVQTHRLGAALAATCVLMSLLILAVRAHGKPATAAPLAPRRAEATATAAGATPATSATAVVAAPVPRPPDAPPDPLLGANLLIPSATPAVPDVGTPLPTDTAGTVPSPGPTVPPTPLPAPPAPAGPLREEQGVEAAQAGPPGPLSGIATSPRRVTLRPIAVMLDNYAPDARPQTGLGQASLVYETVAEYGITRFMAVYLEHEAGVVGPVRSTRVYFNEWANGLNAILVHAGGNSDAMPQLGLLHGLMDVDEIGAPMWRWQGQSGPLFFWRSTDRLIPHNLYTSVPAVRAQVARHHFPVRGHFPIALPHKQNAPLSERPASGWLTVAFSSYAYAVGYRYNPHSNRYKRFMGGQPHIEASTGRQLAPRNVVVIFCPVRPDPASTTPYSVVVATMGSGDALLFQDGRVKHGTWQRRMVKDPLLLRDLDGRPWRFNPGQTWIEAVPQGNPVTWSPWSGR